MEKGKRLAVFSIRESKGGSTWIRVGSAFINKDESINVFLDVLPIDGRLHIRESAERMTMPDSRATYEDTSTDKAD